MPIFGKLDEIRKRYKGHAGVVKGLEYLAALDPNPPMGEVDGPALKVEVEGEALFALNQSYHAKPEGEGRFEAHRKYIDIQYIVSGRELILTLPLDRREPTVPYDAARDVAFYPGIAKVASVHASSAGGPDPDSAASAPEASRIILTPGTLAIFFPEDLHAPSLAVGEGGVVEKVVVKVGVR